MFGVIWIGVGLLGTLAVMAGFTCALRYTLLIIVLGNSCGMMSDACDTYGQPHPEASVALSGMRLSLLLAGIGFVIIGVAVTALIRGRTSGARGAGNRGDLPGPDYP